MGKPGPARVNQVPFPMKSRLPAQRRWFDAALRVLTALVPAALAAAGASSVAPASHDVELVRTAGAGFTGAFRALDLVVSAPAILVPIGTRAFRAGLASAVVTGICGAIAFDLARELVKMAPSALARLGLRGPTSGEVSPRLVSAVSAVAVLTALLAPAWQVEASAPGGAVTGAALVLVALRLATLGVAGAAERQESEPERSPSSLGAALPPALLFVLGLAASYEPLVFLAAIAGVGPSIVTAVVRSRKHLALDRHAVLHGACAFGLGLLPLALGAALAQRAPEIAVAGPMFSLLERAVSPTGIGAVASAEVGAFLLVFCAGGAALSLVVGEARRVALPLVLVVAVALLAVRLGTASGPSRYSAPVLAGLLSAHILGASMLGAVVLAIARARVPFAEASAALVVVLELVLPVRSIDLTTARREARASHASAIWNDIAWGAAPPAAVVLVADRGTMRRVASARAAGHMRGDLIVVPAYDVQGREGQRALLAEPKLTPLYRDMALGVPPEELSLAQLGSQRPVLGSFDPKWDRTLSRHLIPSGLISRFETEPRGASDRKKALDAFLPSKDRLVRIAVAKKDAELASATAALLRARAVGMAATGERDMLSRALDDLRAFAPDDAIGATLVRRIVTTKGPIDVRDLSP